MYRILDEDGVELALWDESDSCGPYDGKCGGCGTCLLQQAWYSGLRTEQVLIVDTEHGAPAVVKR